jgi:O-antigen/teichoic acid export membrane protein
MSTITFHEGDVKKVARGAAFTSIGFPLGKGIFFLIQFLIARLFGPEIFGLYTLGFTTVKICEIIAGIGLQNGGLRFVSVYKDEPCRLKGILLSGTCISIFNGVIIGTIMYFSSKHISELIFHIPKLSEYLKLFALSVPFVSGVSIISYLLLGFQETKYTVYIRDFIQPLVNLLLLLFFFYVDFGLTGTIHAFTLSYVVAFLVGLFYFIKIFPGLTNKDVKPYYELKKLAIYSIPLFFVNLLHYFFTWINVFMIGLLSSTEDVGIFQTALNIPLAMGLFIVAINSIYGPVIADLYYRKEMIRFAAILKTTTRWISYIIIPIFIFIVFSAKEVMLIFGNQYAEKGTYVLIIIAFGKLVHCLTGGTGITLTMTNKQKIELLNSIGVLILCVVLNIVLIPKLGILGAAISTCAAIVLVNIFRIVEISILYKMQPFSKHIVNYFVPSFFSIAALFLIKYGITIEMSAIVSLLGNLFVVFIIFTIFWLICLGKLNKEDQYVIEKIKTKICRIRPFSLFI